jgi:hypothetical protein
MNTEEKIKEIIRKAVEDTLIIRSWNSDDDNSVKEIQNLLASEIREAKIKAYEACCEGIEKYSGTVAFLIIQGKIKELKEGGKEKGKV